MSYEPVPTFDRLKLSIQAAEKHRASLITLHGDGHYYQYFAVAPRGTADATAAWGTFRVEYYDAGGEDGETYREGQFTANIAWTDRTNVAHWDASTQ